MKKQIITIVCSLGFTAGALAQGTLNWAGPSFSVFTAVTNTTVYSSYSAVDPGGSTGGGATGKTTTASAASGSGFYFELLLGATGTQWAAPTTFSQLSSWTDTGLSATNGTTAGRFAVVNSAAAQAVTGVSLTQSNNLVMVGWSADLGSTWSTASANAQSASFLANLASQNELGLWAVSNPGYEEGSSSAISGNVLFGTPQIYGIPIDSLNTQFEVLGVTTTPEPGTMALAALGGASLLLFRRRKI